MRQQPSSPCPSSPFTTLHFYVRIYSSFLPQLLTKICEQGCQFFGTEIDSDDIVCYGCDPRGGSVTKSNVLPCSGRDCSPCIDSESLKSPFDWQGESLGHHDSRRTAHLIQLRIVDAHVLFCLSVLSRSHKFFFLIPLSSPYSNDAGPPTSRPSRDASRPMYYKLSTQKRAT